MGQLLLNDSNRSGRNCDDKVPFRLPSPHFPPPPFLFYPLSMTCLFHPLSFISTSFPFHFRLPISYSSSDSLVLPFPTLSLFPCAPSFLSLLACSQRQCPIRSNSACHFPIHLLFILSPIQILSSSISSSLASPFLSIYIGLLLTTNPFSSASF